MSIEKSDDPQSFGNFEHDGWETVSKGYDQHFANLTSQSVGALLESAKVSRGRLLYRFKQILCLSRVLPGQALLGKMTVVRRFAVNWPEQIQLGNDICRFEAEYRSDRFDNRGI